MLKRNNTDNHLNSGYICENPAPLAASTLLGAFSAKRIMRTYSITAVDALRLTLKIRRNTALRGLLNRSIKQVNL